MAKGLVTDFFTPVIEDKLARYGIAVTERCLPGCVMYAKATVFDLVLPRIAVRVRVGRGDLRGLGHGGLCLGCGECRYPIYPFGKGG